tara:strand:+ start:11122 stop:11706 length:585 start_codon:yes stop_codon:yes gene_type:complete
MNFDIYYDGNNKTLHFDDVNDGRTLPPLNPKWILLKKNMSDEFVEYLITVQDISLWEMSIEQCKYLIDYSYKDFLINEKMKQTTTTQKKELIETVFKEMDLRSDLYKIIIIEVLNRYDILISELPQEQHQEQPQARPGGFNVYRGERLLPGQEDIYKNAIVYARAVPFPGTNTVINLRRAFNAGANYIVNHLKK